MFDLHAYILAAIQLVCEHVIHKVDSENLEVSDNKYYWMCIVSPV